MDLKKLCQQYDECFRRLTASYEVIAELEKVVRSESTSLQKVAEIIEKDPGLTTEILKVVNSPYYGFPRKIASVPHAVVLLGIKNIRIIVLTVSFFKSDPRLSTLWAHSQWVSYMAKELLKVLLKSVVGGNPILLGIDPTVLATAGILHDIGKIPPLLCPNFLDLQEKDHTEIGLLVSTCFDFPPELCQAIAFHHEPRKSPAEVAMIYLIYFADEIVNLRTISEDSISEASVFMAISKETIKAAIQMVEDQYRTYLEKLRRKRRR